MGAEPPPLMSFPIEVDHPLVPLWPHFEHDLINILGASPVSWSALEVFRRRRSLEPSNVDDTTVIITANKDDEQAWSDLQTEIEGYLKNQGQATLQVEMIDGVVTRCGSGDMPDCEYTMEPTGGAGVGVAGVDWTSGTFGGYVLLTRKGHASLKCVLTCHHVLRPTRKDSKLSSEPPPTYDPVLDMKGHHHKGVVVDGQDNVTMLVDQPNFGDHTANLERSRQARDSYQEQIKEIEKKRDAGFDSTKLRLGETRLKQAVESTRETDQIARRFDRVFGHTFATSGYIHAHTGCVLDWGLILVRTSRLGRNIVSLHCLHCSLSSF